MNKLQLLIAATSLVCSPALAAPGEGSFTPTSILVPLHFVRLENSQDQNMNAEIYRCPTESGFTGSMVDASMADDDAGAASDGCLVDMADDAALAALFAGGADVAVGTYDRMRIYMCGFDGAMGYSSFVKGSVDLDGTTYYTSAGSEVLTSDASSNDYTRVEYSGCAADIPLQAPMLVQEGQAITLSAFFSLRNLAWATLSGNGPPGGCTFNAAHDRNVCTGYPIPVTYVGTAQPTLETYHITEDQTDLTGVTAGGQVLLLVAADGTPFGGFSRRLYSATSVNPTVSYDTPIKLISANLDMTTYTVETYGGSGAMGEPVGYYIRFPSFELQTHDGMLQRYDGMPPISYRAVKQ